MGCVKSEPQWYCSDLVRVSDNIWEIDDDAGPLSGSWSYGEDEAVRISGFIEEQDEARIALFREQGFFAEGLNTFVTVGMRDPSAPEGERLTLRGKDFDLGPSFFRSRPYAPDYIRFDAARFGDLIADDGNLILIVQNAGGDTVREVSVPNAALKTTAARLNDMFAKVEFDRLDKPARCKDHRNDIRLGG